METVTLYRPVGPKELELIKESGYKAFLPRLPEQPIFYPVVFYEYAVQIARDWNSDSEDNNFEGFVTKFEIKLDYISGFEIKQAGNSTHLEYWIDSSELDNFNNNISGPIEVTDSFKHKIRI